MMKGAFALALSAVFMTASNSVAPTAQARGDENSPAAPQSENLVPPSDPNIHHERPSDPPAPESTLPPRGFNTPTEAIVVGRFTSIQVNVDGTGANIPGDAANEPSIAVDPTDPSRMVIGWRQFDTILSNFRQAGYAYSHDAGGTWTFPGVHEPNVFTSDPVLAADLDGNIYYLGLQPSRGPGDWACYLYKTGDAGVTWPQEVYAFGGDKAWYTVDQSQSIGSGNIYIAWSRFAGCCGLDLFTRSTDGGMTFDDPIRIPGSPWAGTVAVDLNGTLYVAGASTTLGGLGGGFVVSRSIDARDPLVTPSFANKVSVDLGGTVGLSTVPNPVGLLGQVWIATDHSTGPTRGNLYLLASVLRPQGGADVMFARSTDGGVIWSEPQRINDDPTGSGNWQWFGTMSVAPNGRIDVIWNDTRNDAAAVFSELYYSFSFDGGESWSVNEPAGIAFNHHLGYPQQNKLGDYYHMLSDNAGADLAYAATYNGEQDVYYLRLTPDCNGNGIGDVTEINDETSEDCNENVIPDQCEVAADCNTNGATDICDLFDGSSLDCNYNLVPDACDISGGSSPDADSDGVPDECQCTVPDRPYAPPGAVQHNRYLPILVQDPGRIVAIRVTYVDLPPPLESLVGRTVWVSDPVVVTEQAGSVDPSDAPGFPTFLTGQLGCSPAHRDWSALGTVYAYGEGIVPGGRYHVQLIDEGCNSAVESLLSTPLVVATGRWGDVVSNCATDPCGPPDGVVDITTDVTVILNKFKNLPGAPIKSRADLDFNLPDQLVNISDVTMALDAFGGFPYPFVGPPLVDPCP